MAKPNTLCSAIYSLQRDAFIIYIMRTAYE